MERPAWTVCFGLIWATIAVGAIICHLAVAKVTPAIAELPERLVYGFDNVLGLGTLAKEIKNVEAEAEKIITKCSLTVAECPRFLAQDATTLIKCRAAPDTDSTAAKTNINAAFGRGLSKIEKLGKDKYFGVAKLAEVGGYLDEVEGELNKAPDNGDCCTMTAVFCVIHDKAEVVYSEVQEVEAQIDAIISSDAIKDFEEQASKLAYLHALPYLLVISTLFFSCLWFKNGACCCCKGGSMLDCCGPILLQSIFWLISFIIMTIIAAIGWVVQYVIMEAVIPAQDPKIFVGEPKIGDVLDHIKDVFPDFWKYVFDGLVEGLEMMRTAATIFVVVCLVVAVYSCAFCCARPYPVEEKDGCNKSMNQAPAAAAGGNKDSNQA